MREKRGAAWAPAARRLAATLNTSRVTVDVFPGVGHGVLRQAPQLAFELLRRFLRQIDPSTSGSAAVPG
jgi:pimeloyl-ACP methyl ester carboxylesterase